MDQNVITNWAAHFAAFGPYVPIARARAVPMYDGEPRPSVVFVKSLALSDLAHVAIEGGESLFAQAKEIHEANGAPELWVFSHLGGPPWHVPASRSAAPSKKRGFA